MITDKTLDKLLDFYFDSATHEMQNLDKILIQFQIRFWELTGQEEMMVSLYSGST
ncbi:MAG: hypothetical protein IPG39_15425 [Bacteroidetes bacterium]|nr:hypothetical protein [Bacteroidota bacterium]